MDLALALRIYLRDHEAAARAGADLFDRIGTSQRSRPWGAELVALGNEVRADLGSLHQVMDELAVPPDPGLGLVARAAEKLSRLKPNGRLLVRTPLTDLVEIEGATDAVHAKSNGWRMLSVAGVTLSSVDLEALLGRAEDQRDRLLVLHAAATSALRSR